MLWFCQEPPGPDQYVSVGTTYTLWRVRPPVLRSAGSEVRGAAETEPEPAESR